MTALALSGTAAQAVTADSSLVSGLGIRLLDAPTARRDDPRAQVYIVDFVPPGTRFTRHLEVTNASPTARHVEVYPVSATIAGGAFVAQPGRTPNELTSWMTVSPSSLDLPAQGKGMATVTVTVPSDASSGERYALVLAEVGGSTGAGLRQTSRVGIRTYLSVGKGGEPASNFTVDSLSAGRDSSGAPVVRALVHNTGGRALDMRGTLSLSDGPGGLSAGPFAAQLGSTLAPRDTQSVTVRLDKALPAGPWKALVDLRSGLLERKATATITFPAAGTSAPVRATAVPLPEKFHALVSVAAALAALVVISLAVLLRRRRLTLRRSRADR